MGAGRLVDRDRAAGLDLGRWVEMAADVVRAGKFAVVDGDHTAVKPLIEIGLAGSPMGLCGGC